MSSAKPEIWLLSAGRRYSFVERLIKAGFDVVAFETSKDVPIADICRVEATNYKTYRNQALQLAGIISFENRLECKKRIILPMSDGWSGDGYLELLEAINDYNLNIPIVGSVYNYHCYNKLSLENKLLASYEFAKYYPKFSIFHDAVVKPKNGCGSKGIMYIPSYNIFDKIYALAQPNCVIQRHIIGTEYSVDAYFSKNHQYINGVVRTRDRVADGEVVNSRIATSTYERLNILEATKDIGNYLKLVGPMCFQFIRSKENDQPYLIEINARFGGGSILSLEAGFDMIRMIREEYIDNIDISYWKAFKPQYKEMKRVFRETFRP